ncbi:metallophosphoesterase family protein [Desulfurococcus amylolyticus]|uniref:metallophosphoesterase family protein n=1 Tax=Desulfurococcus amylolyticus TaxID=94694 RepID=UPI0005B1D343|nr:phosphoesterase [Desulfurococcus amylolyticus]
MNNILRVLALYELNASRTLSRLTCLAARILGVDAVILLGDTVSPLIIKWLYEKCGLRVLGVTGRLDDESIPQYLKSIGGLLDGRVVELKNHKITGLGASPITQVYGKIDVLATFKPGFMMDCCNIYSDVAGRIIEAVNPSLTLAGGCRDPCMAGRVIAPGSIQKDYLAYVEFRDGDYAAEIISFRNLLRDLHLEAPSF